MAGRALWSAPHSCPSAPGLGALTSEPHRKLEEVTPFREGSWQAVWPNACPPELPHPAGTHGICRVPSSPSLVSTGASSRSLQLRAPESLPRGPVSNGGHGTQG